MTKQAMRLVNFELICGRLTHGVFSFRQLPLLGSLARENKPPFCF